ncbi:MAG: class I SAM-dependent methyltransferase [Nocardioides sp.]|jgi:trans-aconitate 2-methyltransferase
MPREWDATTYDALTLPHEQWGRLVLDRMRLSGDERVLDAGCGTGRDAAALRERWPGVRLVELDGSQQMLDVARGRLGDDGVTYVQADLRQPLPLDETVDAVMSVAAFHWVPDHAALFEHLAAVLRPGGRLTSDCGGHGNVADVSRAIADVSGQAGTEWEFADDVATRSRLEAAGFEAERVSLRPDPFRCDDPDVLETYLATVVLGARLDVLPADEHETFVREVRHALSEPVVDYVRLEIDAVRR